MNCHITRRRAFGGAVLILVLLLGGCAGSGRAPIQDPVVDRLLAFFQQWSGVPYRLGGASRRGVDCSAFVQHAFRDVFNFGLPRQTVEQSRHGRRVRKSDLRRGDLVFFKTGWRQYHVGISLGGNVFIHAAESSGVSRSSLSTPYWAKRFWKARRIKTRA